MPLPSGPRLLAVVAAHDTPRRGGPPRSPPHGGHELQRRDAGRERAGTAWAGILLMRGRAVNPGERVAVTRRVIIYTTKRCPYCVLAKELLVRKGIPFEEIDVERDDE